MSNLLPLSKCYLRCAMSIKLVAYNDCNVIISLFMTEVVDCGKLAWKQLTF